MKRRIGDHRRPPALNAGQAIGGVDLAFRAGPGVGFPGAGNRLGLDIHTVYHTQWQALIATVALQPAADHAGATGKVQHLVCFQRGLFQGFQQHPGAGIQLPFAEHTRQAGYVKAYAGTGNLRPAQPVGQVKTGKGLVVAAGPHLAVTGTVDFQDVGHHGGELLDGSGDAFFLFAHQNQAGAFAAQVARHGQA